MIKWDGFGKLLKLSFFILLISCFGLLGNLYVNGAGAYQPVGLTGYASNIDSNYNITFLKGGGLITNFLGTSRGVLALRNDVIFWRTPAGLPYVYMKADYGNVAQGFFDRYYSCSVISGYDFTDCVVAGYFTGTSIDSANKEILTTFFKQVNPLDYAYYNYSSERYVGSTYDYRYNKITVCWSSESIGKSICFNGGYCYPSSDVNCNFYAGKIGNLVNSQGYDDLLFSTIPLDSIGYAPGQVGYGGGGNIDGGSAEVSNSQITGDLMTSTCTRQRALNWYKLNGYSEKLCYASYDNNFDIFEGAGTVNAYALTGESIIDVWFDTWDYRRSGITGTQLDYLDWLSYWRNTYEVYQRNSETYTNPFLGVPVSIFTLMGNIDIYGKPYTNESIIDYCNLLLLETPLSNPYEGVYSSQICSQSALDILADTVGLHAESGQVVEGSSWDGITNRPGMHNPPVGNGGVGNSSSSGSSSSVELDSYQDGLTFQNGIFNLLKSTYKNPDGTGSNGIIPSYIIVAFICILFFKLIKR